MSDASAPAAPAAPAQKIPWLGLLAVLLGTFISTLNGRLSSFGLSDIRGARCAAAEIAQLGLPLAGLLNKAGIMPSRPGRSAQGWDLAVATNHLGPFAFTEALIPHALDKWLGINGNWFLLFGGVILIFTLIQHPEGVAGAFYKRMHRGKRPGPTREERVFSAIQAGEPKAGGPSIRSGGGPGRPDVAPTIGAEARAVVVAMA